MTDINATNTLAQANAQAIELAAPTDESLNAGALLPDEPVPDTLTTTLYADADAVMKMLPELQQQAVVATESHGNALRYLRQDLLAQRGMCQRIANEAMAILPNFGKGRPINFYSRHPSATGFQMALEEIDAGIEQDLIGQLTTMAMRLENVVGVPGIGQALENLDFKRRADQVSMQASILKDFIGTAVENGFTWDDACFQGCAVDPSQNGYFVPEILNTDKKWPNFMASMDEYYKVHQDAPAMMELMTTHLNQWKLSFMFALEALKDDADGIKPDLPKAPTVYFNFGRKTTSIDNIADVFTSAEDKLQEPAQARTTYEWLRDVGNAAQQARVEDIINRARSYVNVANEVAGLLKEIAAQLTDAHNTNAGAVKDLGQMATAFIQTAEGMNQGFFQIVRWCVNAGMATSYVGVLADRVIEHAWKSVNQCRETMQMRESAYQAMKLMVEDLQAAVRTNTL
jgi:hypothetical protein